MNKKLFGYIKKKKGNSVSFQFLEKLVALALIVYFVVIPLAGDQIAQTLLGSATVIAAVVGLAASDVIKDMCAGLQISIYKPFDVGSRIQLQDGRAGIVEKLTLRHVVLRLIDTTRIIVPNREINSMMLVNYSYEEEVPRALELRFPISYDSDIEKAKKIIRETICSCKVTLNENKFDANDPNSKSVYFLELSANSLIMGATVYYPHCYRTEVVRDEVNTSVFENLKKNGIEIPYNYVNVVMNQK
ncbi:MAG: mechanosensitive ion channel family protein [Lachnospiraceae bacterium]|nr:mechanosensitive ion channel family protein [Lachnospiraceae bacterium]